METRILPKTRKHNKVKVPGRLGIEMILRKSFIQSLKEYVRNCSLPGVKHFCDPALGWFQRAIWAVVFCTAMGTIWYFLLYVWSDVMARPLIVTLESSTYPIGSIDFPAVAICNNNRISKKALEQLALEEYADLSDNGKESLEAVTQMITNWGRLITFSYNGSLQNNPIFKRMIDKYRYDTLRVDKIMRTLAPSCADMLMRCAWEGNIVDCESIFSMHKVANRGHCCTFNYWSANRATTIKRQKEPGHIYGLNLLLDPLLDDYAYPMHNILGFEILMFDPAQFADPNAGRVVQTFAEPNMALQWELKSTKQIASAEVKKYNLDTRKCLFHDEDVGGNLFEVYSYSTCIVMCRVNTIISLCKCMPYFYKSLHRSHGFQSDTMCTLENLKCLNKYREKLYYLYPINTDNTDGLELEMQNSLYCPNCLPDCELTQYASKAFETPLATPFANKGRKSSFSKNLNITNRSYLSIYHPLPDAKLNRLDVVFYWFELLSNIGGFSGIVMGFSVISAVEIFYFFSIRFLAHFIENYGKYH